MSIKFSIVQSCIGFAILLLVAGVFAVFYLSWLPDPVLSNYNILPDWLARWTDTPKNDKIRTAVPFVYLGFVAGIYLAVTYKGWRWWLGAWAGLTLIVLIAEAGQLTLPHRSFDWGDVAWGSIGSLGSLVLVGLGLIIILTFTRKLR